MFKDINTLYTVLSIISSAIGLFALIRSLKSRAWIKTAPKKQQSKNKKNFIPVEKKYIGFLDYQDGPESAVVHLAGAGNCHPIGKVFLHEGKGMVHVLATPLEESGEEPHYIPCGFINVEDAFIYEQRSEKDLPKKIGYLARPSDPNTPTIKGEFCFSFKFPFIKKKLNAYWGLPEVPKKAEDTKTEPDNTNSQDDSNNNAVEQTDASSQEQTDNSNSQQTEDTENQTNQNTQETPEEANTSTENQEEQTDNVNPTNTDSDTENTDQKEQDSNESATNNETNEEKINSFVQNRPLLAHPNNGYLVLGRMVTNDEPIQPEKNSKTDEENVNAEKDQETDDKNTEVEDTNNVVESTDDIQQQDENLQDNIEDSDQATEQATETEQIEETEQSENSEPETEDLPLEDTPAVPTNETTQEESAQEDAKEETKEETKEERKKREKEEKEKEKAEQEALKKEQAEIKKREKAALEKAKKEKEKKVAAECESEGWPFDWPFRKSELSAVARACGYGVFYNETKKTKNYSEYYNRHSYGWLDTALLSSLVYTIIFTCIYVVNTGLLKLPLLGNDLYAVVALIIFYFILWVLIRFLKIEAIETSNTVQPKLDLLNKSLGLKYVDISILIFSAVGIYFTYEYYDYDFIPLIFAIAAGITLNMFVPNVKTPWSIQSTLRDETLDPEYEKPEIPENPEGDIARTYDWELDSENNTKLHGNLTLYFDQEYITDVRQFNPFYNQRMDKPYKDYVMDMFKFMKEHDRTFMARVEYIAYYIKTLAAKNNLCMKDTLQFVLDFVQEPNIKFTSDINSKFINYNPNYVRFPDETLFDKEGDSDCKAFLAATILHCMSYRVVFLTSKKHKHAALGIEYTGEEWMGKAATNKNIFIHEGHKYLFCETTSDGFRLGGLIDGMTLDDFESRVELTYEEDEEATTFTETRLYNWDLDSHYGQKLHGQLVLEMNVEHIATLRANNPFKSYPENGKSYDDNIREMLEFVESHTEFKDDVKKVVKYINQKSEDAKLYELDKLQFALDFVQIPNIQYMFDEECATINFAKEYMRFPAEVLYDKVGDCDCKTSLAASIFHEMGYNVLILLSNNHAAIGLECRDEDWLAQIGESTVQYEKIVALSQQIENGEKSEEIKLAYSEQKDIMNKMEIMHKEGQLFYCEPTEEITNYLQRAVKEYNGKKYLFCETTADGFKVGEINEKTSMADFNTIVEIPA